MNKFFSRDPEKALIEIKEMLYERNKNLQDSINVERDKDIKLTNHQMTMIEAWMEEMEFLSDLLNIIERS